MSEASVDLRMTERLESAARRIEQLERERSRLQSELSAPARKAVSEALVKALLDTAFQELQHDTGAQDKEYVFQRNSLERRFKKILNAKSHRISDKAEERSGLSARTAGEPAPAFWGYVDDDECMGKTIEEYIRQRIGEPIIDALVVGDEFAVSACYARDERWRIASGPMLENPAAPIVCERIDPPSLSPPSGEKGETKQEIER